MLTPYTLLLLCSYAHVNYTCLALSPTNLWYQEYYRRGGKQGDLAVHTEIASSYDGLAGTCCVFVCMCVCVCVCVCVCLCVFYMLFFYLMLGTKEAPFLDVGGVYTLHSFLFTRSYV